MSSAFVTQRGEGRISGASHKTWPLTRPRPNFQRRICSQIDSTQRAVEAGIFTKIGNHSFRTTSIAEYLRNGGKLKIAQQMPSHENARTAKFRDLLMRSPGP